MEHSIGIVGAPTSAGAFAPGQEKTPSALRNAGLVDWLSAAGLDVVDYGDVLGYRWQPDRENPRMQNLAQVLEVARSVSLRVSEIRAAGRRALVLGGDCTVELGTVSGHLANQERVGLVYFDMHADLNVPEGRLPVTSIGWESRTCSAFQELLSNRHPHDSCLSEGSGWKVAAGAPSRVNR